MNIDNEKMLAGYPEICSLFNKWMNKTMLLSTGNCNVPEWDILINYGKEHDTEFAGFAYDYLDIYGSNWMILSMIDNIIGCPIVDEDDSYINPNTDFVKTLYMIVCNAKKEGNLEVCDDKSLIIKGMPNLYNNNMKMSWNNKIND